MDPTHFLGVALALCSAVAWGGGDFSGGLASRRADQGEVLVLAALSGLAMLVAVMLLSGEPLPTLQSAWLAVAAGASGGIGLGALYWGLSRGRTASFAPSVAVIGASVPVMAGALTVGLPEWTEIAGLGVALVGLWFLTRGVTEERTAPRGDLLLAVAAGLGFGGFFIVIAAIEDASVFGPLALARIGTLAVALVALGGRERPMSTIRVHPAAMMAGLLDAAGNVLYLFATRHTRMDVAAVLGSLYPAVTVLLASRLLAEDVSRSQWGGLALCLGAVGLIAL